MEAPELLRAFHDHFIAPESFYSEIGKAVNVNEEDRTCDFEPIEDKSNRVGIRLQSAIGSSLGLVQIPKEGSFIVVTFFDTKTGFVSLCEEIDKILIDTDLVQFNGGGNGGLINISDNVDKLNNLESKVNELITAFNAHSHITTATVAATPTPGIIAPTTTTVVGSLTATKVSDLEDEKVTH